jgi:capsular exopolysaccharide synthesis family protein
MIPHGKKSAFSDADIMMYLALGLKHLRLMGLLVCVSFSLGLFYYCYARPVYYSRALVRYHTIVQPLDTEKLFQDANARVVLREFLAPALRMRTAKKLGLNTTEKDLTQKHLKQIKVLYDAEGNLILHVWPYSYNLAKAWPEAMVQAYLQNRDERRLERVRKTFQAFNDEMNELRQKMDELFNQKFDFQESNAMTRIIIDLNQYKELPLTIQTIKQKLAVMDQTREALQSPGRDAVGKLSLLAAMDRDIQIAETTARQMSPVAQIGVGALIPKDDPSSGVVVVPSMITSTLKQPWEELDKERRRLQQLAQDTSRAFLPRHPKMVAVQKQLEAVNKSLELELAVEQNRFDLAYAGLVDKLSQLERKLPAHDEIVRRYQRHLNEYAHFDAGQLGWNKIYDDMSKRLQALDFGADNQRDELQFIGFLELNDRPVAPNRFKITLYSLLLGLALAIAVPFFIEYIDSRVSDVDQVEETLHIRALGVVPKVSELPMDSLLLPDIKPDHHVTENFRLIRTNLVMNAATPALPQVILVTSAMPQEGKSVVASHLAMSFARKGEKTLLIDADLRRGRLHRVFGCPNKPGLGEVLTGQHPLESAFRPVISNAEGHHHEAGRANSNGYLTLLTCGKHMHWASELLDSHIFPKLMDELRQKYQRIIIDTPPVLGLSETSIIQRSADGVVLVIWSEYTAMRNVKTAIQMLQTNGAKFSGFVLNRLDFAALTNRYRYFYYSPYYYRNYKTLTAPADPVQT